MNNDGIYDLFLSYHADARIQLYYGRPDGTFKHDPSFDHRIFDVHGIHVGPRSARSRNRLVVVSVGGKRGSKPTAPSVYEFTPKNTFKDITYKYGLGKGRGRGRTAQWMDMSLQKNRARRKNGGGPDLLVLNYLGDEQSPSKNLRQFAFKNIRGKRYNLRPVPGLTKVNRGRVEVTDVDNDGRMEVINIRQLRIFTLIKPFTFRDISNKVFPALTVGELTVSAVAELDYDNDGDWDLYIARTDRTLISNRQPLRSDTRNDILLKNVGGRYVDASREAGIPKGTFSQGVTVGDFNNDGFVDILVMQYKARDMLLLNQADGTFKRISGLIPKKKTTVGNNAVAFDYNRDGRLDVLVGHGERDSKRGTYRLMKNTIKRGGNHYLLVRVGNEPSLGTTALHAVVTVFLGKLKLTRRVGSRGAQGGGGSFLETVHFGLGRVTRVPRIRVRWSNGIQRWRAKVKADQIIQMGRF